MCRVQPAPELIDSVDELLDQHDWYNLGHGFRVVRNRSTEGKWVVRFSHWELSYLLAAQFQKPRVALSLKFETVQEAIAWAQRMLDEPKVRAKLQPFLEDAAAVTAGSDRRRA